ncbi:hypothetical protein [Kitasatospora cathayae]|uniref:Uncharacterized protein n=1 Tax=Kitasatospora cathayae TaxID=3004092 RepID=A0ABY7QHB5_9ACTN|nr:hypothetical protein [Kitasatospora sp. HUAS 3-15]WBP91927.1 hypothetical protein O1G21_36305 [Kitasatospora sp. HUAS 3-15]
MIIRVGSVGAVRTRPPCRVIPSTYSTMRGPGTPMLGTTGLWANFKAIAAGDFLGTGKTAVAGIDANNNLKFCPGDGAGHVSGGTQMLPGNGLWARL